MVFIQFGCRMMMLFNYRHENKSCWIGWIALLLQYFKIWFQMRYNLVLL